MFSKCYDIHSPKSRLEWSPQDFLISTVNENSKLVFQGPKTCFSVEISIYTYLFYDYSVFCIIYKKTN